MAYSLAEKLYANRPYEETVDVLGLKIKFRVLSAADEDQIVASSGAQNFLVLLATRKIPTLARAIVSIDGVRWEDFDEIQQLIRSNPGMTLTQATERELSSPKYSDEVVSQLYLAYNDFHGRYKVSLEGLKKNSTPPSPVTAG